MEVMPQRERGTPNYFDVMKSWPLKFLIFQTVSANILAASKMLWLFIPGWKTKHGTLPASLAGENSQINGFEHTI
jgi:hypothetical protein